jgi:hypothetical protein
MRSLQLFRPSFQRLQLTLAKATRIKEELLPRARKQAMLGRDRAYPEKFSRSMLVLNSIEHNAVDLQTEAVQKELGHFQQFLGDRGMSASYDYEGRGFKLISERPLNDSISSLSLHLRSQGV